MRDKINVALKDAMKTRDEHRTSTLRLILAAIKERDIEARAEDRCEGATNDEILAILQKMVKQRLESSQTYEEAGRLDLAEQEREEMDIIQDFLPRQLSDTEVRGACEQIVQDVGATGLKDMRKCLCTLKEQYPGQIDFSKASTIVKTLLRA